MRRASGTKSSEAGSVTRATKSRIAASLGVAAQEGRGSAGAAVAVGRRSATPANLPSHAARPPAALDLVLPAAGARPVEPVGKLDREFGAEAAVVPQRLGPSSGIDFEPAQHPEDLAIIRPDRGEPRVGPAQPADLELASCQWIIGVAHLAVPADATIFRHARPVFNIYCKPAGRAAGSNRLPKRLRS